MLLEHCRDGIPNYGPGLGNVPQALKLVMLALQNNSNPLVCIFEAVDILKILAKLTRLQVIHLDLPSNGAYDVSANFPCLHRSIINNI